MELDSKRCSRKRRSAVEGVICPRCLSEAIYRYGRSANGKKRYLCQACRRQFVVDRPSRLEESDRPSCPACGKPMHVYMRCGEIIRFRCADYPHCRMFLKSPKADFSGGADPPAACGCGVSRSSGAAS